MNRFDNVEEKEMYEFLDRMTSKNDFWAVEKPIPEKIGFQRFGLQLREEDFEQHGLSYRGFFLRDRNEVRKATSGFSVVRNDEEEFKVDLDVWPFKRDELAVMVVPGKYFTVKGEHEEKFEDNSECTRKFQRYYCLPRGSNSDTIKCSYCDGTLSIRVDKEGVSETRGAQTVPINLVTCRENKVVPIEKYTPVTPTEIREVPIANDSFKNDNEPAIKATTPSKEVPVTTEDLKSDSDVIKKAKESLLKAVIANIDDLKSEAVTNARKLFKEAIFASEDLERKNEAVQKATESLETIPMANEISNVYVLVDEKTLTSDNGK